MLKKTALFLKDGFPKGPVEKQAVLTSYSTVHSRFFGIPIVSNKSAQFVPNCITFASYL